MIESKIEIASARFPCMEYERKIKFERQIRTEDSAGVKIKPTEETKVTITDKSGASLSFWIGKQESFDIAELIIGREINGNPC